MKLNSSNAWTLFIAYQTFKLLCNMLCANTTNRLFYCFLLSLKLTCRG